MENHSHRLMLGCSAAAILLSMGTAAVAQEGNETVVVSSTRLNIAGFDAPTPTTMIGVADIEKNAQPSVFDAITQLPALQGSTGVSYNTGSTTTGLMGLSSFNLRGLGVLRTLVLIDGQRVVGGNPNGAVDVSQMPQALIQRVDVVTGGASASWGSDAISGVVNFVTDKKFEGFKANLLGGQSTYGDDQNATFQFAAGTSFLDGRAHWEVAGEYSYTGGIAPPAPIISAFKNVIYPGGRNIYSTIGTADRGANSPAGNPRYHYGALAQNPTNTQPYGIVTNGAKNGMKFVNGIATPIDLAGNNSAVNVSVTNCAYTPSISSTGLPIQTLTGSINGTCFGTSSDPGDQTHGWTHTLADPLTRGNVYTRLSYDLGEGTEIYATALVSSVRTQAIPAQGNSSNKDVSFKCDNAFLPATDLFGNSLTGAQTLSACNALYQTPAQVTAGTNGSFTVRESAGNFPVNQVVNLTRDQRRFVVGADGAFNLLGTDWTWDTYGEHGEGSVSIRILNMPLKNRFNLAQDAVYDTTANNGQGGVVCRDANARLNGCVPYNPFTPNNIDSAALSYIDNQALGSRVGGPFARQSITQDAFNINFSGSPVELWAGKLGVAFGFDYRQEKFWQYGDVYSGGIVADGSDLDNTRALAYQGGCLPNGAAITATTGFTDNSLKCLAPGSIVPGAPSTGYGNEGNWNAGNYGSGRGNYHVWELYTEIGIPLLNMPDTIGKVDGTIAGRFERYSTAGDFTTWKVGLTWETPIPGVRMRALQSRDTRAPNLVDLYSPPQTLNGSFNNDFCSGLLNNGTCTTGTASAGQGQVAGQTVVGNTNLSPERGQTTEIGVVYQPDFLPGFQISMDYYRIAVKGIISAPSLQQIVDGCFAFKTGIIASDSGYCNLIVTANGAPLSTTVGAQGLIGQANAVTQIKQLPFNSAGFLTDGFDIESSYQFDLQDWNVPGDFVLRALVNHTSKFLYDPGIPLQFTQERAGVLGGGFNSAQYNVDTGNVLTWKTTTIQNWQGEKWGFNITERWYAGGDMQGRSTTANNPLALASGSPGAQWIRCSSACPAAVLTANRSIATTDAPPVPAVTYVDVGGSYQWSDKTQFYFKIDNVANQIPPNTGNNEVNNTLYDVVGRMYRVGVRFND